MIVTALMLCGGPGTGGRMWIERGHTYRVAREEITVLLDGGGIRGPLVHGAASVAVATLAERKRLRFAERQGRDPRPWTLHEGRPIPRAPRVRAD